MQIQGHTLEEQDELSEEFQALVLAAMQSVIDTVVLRVVRQGASQGLTAAGSVDDVADDVIILWDDQIPELVTYLDGVYDAGSLEAASELAAQLTMPDGMGIPGIPDSFTLDHMSQASNRLKGIGDDVWENIRSELVVGIQNGDSIDELAQRVRIAGSMSEARAKTIARTELVGASNAGTHTQVLMIVPESKKEWVSTADMRTRQTHLHADGQLVPVNATFTVGAAHLRYPGDPGGLVGEIVNCRCTLIYDVDDDAEPETICSCAGTIISAYVPVTSSSCTCKVTYPTPSGAGTFNVTPSQHKQIFDAFMGKQPISPAYGGAKIYKKLQEARAELANTAPHLSGLSDHEILAIVDESYDGAKKFTFTQKFDEWLASPAGKKAAPSGPTPAKSTPAAPPTPATSTPTIPSTPSPPTPSTPTITSLPTPTPTPSVTSVLPPIKPKPDPAKLTYTGKTLGSHGAQVWVDDKGGKWLFKPQSKFMTDVDKAMAVLKSKSLATRTGTYDITLGGKHGSIQYMFDDSKDAWPTGKIVPAITTKKEIITLQQEQVFDWLIGNHDAHEGQFVRLPDGTIVGVDKGQAFKFFGTDKLDWTYTAPGNVGTPVYNTLWKAYVDGKVDLPDPTTGPVGDYIQTLMDIPDAEYRALLTSYAKGVPKLPGKYKTVDEFLDAAVARKNNLKKDFADLYQRAVVAKAKKSGGPTPAPVKSVPTKATPAPAPTPTVVPPPPGGVPTAALKMPFKPEDLGNELSVEEIFNDIYLYKPGDVLAEGFTSYNVPMRIVYDAETPYGYELHTEYWMYDSWNKNPTQINTESELLDAHKGLKWQKPHTSTSTPSTSTPSVPLTIGPNIDIMDAFDKATHGEILALGKWKSLGTTYDVHLIVHDKPPSKFILIEYKSPTTGAWVQTGGKITDIGSLKLETADIDWSWTPPPKKTTPSAVTPTPTPATPTSTPSVVTTHAPATPTSITTNQKYKLLGMMKEGQPVTPGWGGAKVYKKLEEMKLKLAGMPEYAGLTDKQLLQLMDEVAGHKTAKTYESVVVDWLNTAPGKKYAGGDANILDKPKPGAVTTPTPAPSMATPTPVPSPAGFAHDAFKNITDKDLLDVVTNGEIVDATDDIWPAVPNIPPNSIIAIARRTDGTYVRLHKIGDQVWFQLQNPTTKSWVDVAVMDPHVLKTYETVGGIKSWRIPPGSELPDVPMSAPTKAFPKKAKKMGKKAGKSTPATPTSTTTPSSPASTADYFADAILNDTLPIDTLSESLQKDIFAKFKDKSVGSYLNGSPNVIYTHILQTLQELKKFPQYQNLTPMQLIRVIDAQGAKKLGATNAKLFEQKITNWLNTPAGKKYADDFGNGNKSVPPKAATPPPTPAWSPPPSPAPVATHVKPTTPALSTASQAAKPVSTRAYSSMYQDEVRKMHEEMQAQQGAWTAAQKSSLRAYTGSSYSDINRCLRGLAPCSPTTLKHIKEAQAGMRRSTRNVILRRGTNADEFPGFGKNATTAELKTLVGRELKADSFLSSSFGDRPAFGGNVMLEFHIPAGVPMAYVKDISKFSSENEILLGAGLRYIVEEVVEESSYKRVVKVRVLVP